MRFLTILLAALTLSICQSPAVDNPPPPAAPPAAPAATAPAPVPPVPQVPVVPPVSGEARKEEEAEKAKAGLLARLKAHVKGTAAMADDVASLRKENTDLQARIKALEDGTELKALREQNEAMRKDISDYIAHVQAHGLQPSAAPQTPLMQAGTQAVAGAVGNQLAALGVPVATLPAAAAADGKAATLAEIEEQLKACKNSAERQALLKKNSALILASS